MELRNSAGTYALVFRCRETGTVRIGRLGTLDLETGYYVYVGSAFGPGGVRARIDHHLRTCRRPHWHIDYLKPHCTLEEIWIDYSDIPMETRWTLTLSECRRSSQPLPGFGASDSAAHSHLFYFHSRPTARLLKSPRIAIHETAASR